MTLTFSLDYAHAPQRLRARKPTLDFRAIEASRASSLMQSRRHPESTPGREADAMENSEDPPFEIHNPRHALPC
jgi:hypothetical protein